VRESTTRPVMVPPDCAFAAMGSAAARRTIAIQRILDMLLALWELTNDALPRAVRPVEGSIVFLRANRLASPPVSRDGMRAPAGAHAGGVHERPGESPGGTSGASEGFPEPRSPDGREKNGKGHAGKGPQPSSCGGQHPRGDGQRPFPGGWLPLRAPRERGQPSHCHRPRAPVWRRLSRVVSPYTVPAAYHETRGRRTAQR
jgi:hypothetical protein